MSFKIQHGQIIPSSVPEQKTKVQGNDFEKTFLEQLKQTKEQVKISAHALVRMDARQITLDEEDMKKINEAMDSLEKKGARKVSSSTKMRPSLQAFKTAPSSQP